MPSPYPAMYSRSAGGTGTLVLSLSLSLGLVACEDPVSQAAALLDEIAPSLAQESLDLSTYKLTPERLIELEDLIYGQPQSYEKKQKLDLRRPEHLEFAVTRLYLNGHTPESTPELYRALAAIQRGDIQRADDTVLQYCDDQAVANPHSQATNGVYYVAKAASQCEPAFFRYTDVYYYSYNPSKPTAKTFWRSNSAMKGPQQLGEVLTDEEQPYVTDSTYYYADSWAFWLMNDGGRVTYGEATDKTDMMRPTELQLTDPADYNGDGRLVFCMNRTVDLDGETPCDLRYTGTNGTITLPVGGDIRLIPPVSDPSRVKLVEVVSQLTLGDSDNPCSNVVTTPMSSSDWQLLRNSEGQYGAIKFPADGKTLDVDLGVTCLDQVEAAQQTGDVRLNTRALVELNGTQITTNYAFIDRIDLAWGCLAGDTQVLLAEDDAPVRIDELVRRYYEQGERAMVVGDGTGALYVVEGVSRGPDADVIEVEDHHGRVLKASVTHPLMTAAGPVRADALKEGDVVETLEGPSELVRVERVPFGADSYNLALRPLQGEPRRDQPATFIANGFVVGDLNAQLALDRPHRSHEPARPLERAEWEQIVELIP